MRTPVQDFSSTAHLSFSLLFGRSEPIITGIDWSRYLNSIQPPFRVLSRLISFLSTSVVLIRRIYHRTWLRYRYLSEVRIPFQAFFSSLLFDRSETNNPKNWLGYRYLSGIHTLPSDFPLLISPPLLLGRSEELARWVDWDMDIWVRYVPTFLSHCMTFFNWVLDIWVSVSLFPGRKHQSKNDWDIETWVISTHSPSEFISPHIYCLPFVWTIEQSIPPPYTSSLPISFHRLSLLLGWSKNWQKELTEVLIFEWLTLLLWSIFLNAHLSDRSRIW